MDRAVPRAAAGRTTPNSYQKLLVSGVMQRPARHVNYAISMRRKIINTLKFAVLAIAAALAGGAAFAAQSAGLPKQQVQGSVGFKAIDNFLADSRRYLDL